MRSEIIDGVMILMMMILMILMMMSMLTSVWRQASALGDQLTVHPHLQLNFKLLVAAQPDLLVLHQSNNSSSLEIRG